MLPTPLTEHHPMYFVAVLVAALAAIILRLLDVPAPWPAAIGLGVYALVAWPVLRERVPWLQPMAYAAAWGSAALLVIAYETLATYAR